MCVYRSLRIYVCEYICAFMCVCRERLLHPTICFTMPPLGELRVDVSGKLKLTHCIPLVNVGRHIELYK